MYMKRFNNAKHVAISIIGDLILWKCGIDNKLTKKIKELMLTKQHKNANIQTTTKKSPNPTQKQCGSDN